MNCPKCNRKVPGNRKTCLYCGESLKRQLLSKSHSAISNINGLYVQSEMVEKIDVPYDSSAALIGFMINANSVGKASFTAMYGR